MRVLKTEEFFYVAGGDGGEGGSRSGSGCTSNDTTASCIARQDGYAACSALASGTERAASVFGGGAARSLAGQVGGACNTAVDNYVNWAYKTPMYEQRNLSAFERSIIASGGTLNYDGA